MQNSIHINRNVDEILCIKRDGTKCAFTSAKIITAIAKAFKQTKEGDLKAVNAIANNVIEHIARLNKDEISVEEIQDVVEIEIARAGFNKTAKSYILYRDKRNKERETRSALNKVYRNIVFEDIGTEDFRRENANINANSPMGKMLKFGSETAKDYYLKHVLSPVYAEAHNQGDIHIHDLDFFGKTLTCCQIDIARLLENGFDTGHCGITTPNDIVTAAALCAIVFQSNQNDQHGGQSIPDFDKDLAPYVKKTYMNKYIKDLADKLSYETCSDNYLCLAIIRYIIEKYNNEFSITSHIEYLEKEVSILQTISKNDLRDTYLAAIQKDIRKGINIDLEEKTILFNNTNLDIERIVSAYTVCSKRAMAHALSETTLDTYQAMQGLIHNLNTMHSRAGAQVPFSSINIGTDTSPEGRLVCKELLLAFYDGLKDGQNPIFPILIYKVKKDVNLNPNAPNHDLYRLALKVAARRLFPTFSFQDSTFNKPFSEKGIDVNYMGCRTRVAANYYKDYEVSKGRGNNSFTTINLVRVAIESEKDMDKFYKLLDWRMHMVIEQILERYHIQGNLKVKDMPFLMGQGIWVGSERLSPNDKIIEAIKHGTLSIGFIGLAEALTSLIGKHHGESDEAQKLGLEIVSHMRQITDEATEKYKLNFTLLATPAEGLAGRFVRIDQSKHGTIDGVTDKSYYTNSFHVPVSFKISIDRKIDIEAPYHNLCNAGHISYIELPSSPINNIDAMDKIVRKMCESNMGYAAINYPLDRCSGKGGCNYEGVIDSTCPKCGKADGEDDVEILRLRRITGYLTTDLRYWNNGKKAEEHDRVCHTQEKQ